MLCAAGLGAVAFISAQFKTSDATYFEFISRDNRAALELMRANRNLAGIVYTAYQLNSYNHQHDMYKFAAKDYVATKAFVLNQLAEARNLSPEHVSEFDAFLARTCAVIARAGEAVAFAAASDAAQAKAALIKADTLIGSLSDDLVGFLIERMDEVEAQSKALTAGNSGTIVSTLITVALLFAAVIGAALFVTSRGITVPIIRLRERMLSLAGGDTAADIDGMSRKDEVGAMAKAVQVFRENAIERTRLQQETEANRSVS